MTLAEAVRLPACAPLRAQENARSFKEDLATLQAAEAVNGLDRVLYRSAQAKFKGLVQEMEHSTGTSGNFPLPDEISPPPPPPHQHFSEKSSPQSLPNWWAQRPLAGKKQSNSKEQLKVFPLGVVIFAVGKGEIQKAFKSAASLRRACPSLEGRPTHVTLVTDMVGVLQSSDYQRSGVFDRAVNAVRFKAFESPYC